MLKNLVRFGSQSSIIIRSRSFHWRGTNLLRQLHFTDTCGSRISIVSSRYVSSFQQNPTLKPEPSFQPSAKNCEAMADTETESVRSAAEKRALSQYILPLDQPVVKLDCDTAFGALDVKEKLYAHYLCQASWYGSLAAVVQTSPESPVILALLLDLFKSSDIADLKRVALSEAGFTEDDWQGLLIYTTGIFGNSGNYKSFGDTKIVPTVPLAKLDALFQNAKFQSLSEEQVQEKWKSVRNTIYSLGERERQLGLGDKGITTYFSSNCTLEDAELINRFMKKWKMQAYMTRCFKTTRDGTVHYEIRSASADPDDPAESGKEITFEDVKIRLTRGDYSPFMAKTCFYLNKAKAYASNEGEVKMLEAYIDCFKTGSLDAHYTGSRYWIKNKNPAIETYIGFIETYRDPAGMRGEFEGFVSIVNRPMSAKFQQLVENATKFLPLLPWPATFEKDKFLKPDFTSLDVLAFGGSGIPAGINIPNYDEIRQNEGFKNVSLGNVITASYKDSVIPFLSAEDQVLLQKYRTTAFELQVGLHELLGHGSGKLLQKKEDGSTNFDPNLTNPLTKQLVESMYDAADSYDSIFTTLGSAYEECRAESVGIYLSLFSDVLKIFGHEGEQGETIKYVNWLSMVYAGVRSLEMYQPATQAWMQAHSQARFVIAQVLIEAGNGLVKIEEIVGKDGPDLLISLDKDKVDTVGRQAMSDFLLKLQVYKSTADITSARNMFNKYSKVDDEGQHPWATWRSIVMDKKQPRKILVQPNTEIQGDNVVLKTYDPSPEGMIQSWVDRFQDDSIFTGLDYCWNKDKEHFNL